LSAPGDGAMRRPWFKFYTCDWRADPALRSCSVAARGLWIDFLTIMHEATPYGHLLINGKVPSYYQISQIVGLDYRVVKNLVAELERNSVFTRTTTSTITSRRMLRDEAKRQRGQEFAKRRWGDLPIAPETRKKERGPTEASKRKIKARQKWENDLLAHAGEERFAELMEVLAAHPELLDRATAAELRKPGSGAMAVVIGLKRLRETAQ